MADGENTTAVPLPSPLSYRPPDDLYEMWVVNGFQAVPSVESIWVRNRKLRGPLAVGTGSRERDDLHFWVAFTAPVARDLEHADQLERELDVRIMSSPVYMTFWRVFGPGSRPGLSIGASCIFDRRLVDLYREVALGGGRTPEVIFSTPEVKR